MNKAKRARLEELIDEATVDCYNEDEEHGGLLTIEAYLLWKGYIE